MDDRVQGVRSARAAEPAQGAVAPAPAADRPHLLDCRFSRAEIAALRHEVRAKLSAAGLAGEALDGFVVAVNEVLTNVVLHAGGHGRIQLSLADRTACCTVTDQGPGIPTRFLCSDEAPPAFETGGRGIWLARQLSDEVTVATGPIGTTIGLRIAVPGGGVTRRKRSF